MELSAEQRQAVMEWVSQGASLAEVQSSLKERFNLAMTFMEVRLLVLEIGAEIKDPLKSDTEAETVASDDMPASNDPYAEEGEPDLMATDSESAVGGVALTVDRVVTPGAIVSGNVTFSDGVKARWLIDQYGRFGLEPSQPGYRPSDTDLQAFQTQIKAELQRHGFA